MLFGVVQTGANNVVLHPVNNINMMIFTRVGETQAVRLGDWLGVLKEVMKVFDAWFHLSSYFYRN